MIKKIHFTSILLFFCIVSVTSQTAKKVLFIGNSYTSVNDLPSMINNMATNTGNTLIYDSNVPGGFRFMNHASNATTLSKINSNTWDYVVLQAQSQETSFGATQLATEVYPYATSLSNAIRANNACSQPLFYMTWGKQNGDASNCPYAPWVCTYEGMDNAIRASYITMGTNNTAEVAPAGAVWRYLRTNNPSINLYSSDESHPSLAGSYAAACALYTMIYKKDPTLITWNSGLSNSDATTIKLAAKTIVFDQISTWDFTVNPAVASYSEVINSNQVSFTNTSAAFDSLVWNFGDGTTSTDENPVHNYSATGFYTVTLTSTKCGKSSTQTKTLQIDTVLNVNEFDEGKRFIIYPNPVSNQFSVALNRTYKTTSVVVFDVLGNTIMKTEGQDLEVLKIDCSSLSSGTYFIKITADQDVYTSKIVKK